MRRDTMKVGIYATGLGTGLGTTAGSAGTATPAAPLESSRARNSPSHMPAPPTHSQTHTDHHTTLADRLDKGKPLRSSGGRHTGSDKPGISPADAVTHHGCPTATTVAPTRPTSISRSMYYALVTASRGAPRQCTLHSHLRS